MTFQDIIYSIENLSVEDQDYLFELIQKWGIENRRLEIAAKAQEILEAVKAGAVKAGTAKKGTVDDLIADLLEKDPKCRLG